MYYIFKKTEKHILPYYRKESNGLEFLGESPNIEDFHNCIKSIEIIFNMDDGTKVDQDSNIVYSPTNKYIFDFNEYSYILLDKKSINMFGEIAIKLDS